VVETLSNSRHFRPFALLRVFSVANPHVSVFTAHLKTEKTPKKETVQALAQMILIAMATQPVLSEPEN
jgi:hypothetical protein